LVCGRGLGLMETYFKIFCLVAFLLLLIGFPFSCKTGEMEYASNEVLIKFKPETSSATIASISQEVGLEKIKEIPKLGVILYKIQSKMTVKEVIERYKDNPHIEYIEPNYTYKLD
jgi:thermitase